MELTFPLRAQKVWQGQGGYLVWSIPIPKPLRDSDDSKKLFLVVDSRRSSAPYYFTSTKPAPLLPMAPFLARFKKRAKPLLLTKLESHPDHHLRFRFQSESGADFFLYRVAATTPYLELVEAEQSLARLSEEGQYTKTKSFEALPHEQWQPISSLIGLAQKSSPQSHTPLPLPKSQRDLAKRVKRRIRTLKKALARYEKDLGMIPQEARARTEAQLLKDYSHLYEKTRHEIDLTSVADAPLAKISLDEGESLGEAIDRRFKALKRNQKKTLQLQDLIQTTSQQIKMLQGQHAALLKAPLADQELNGLATTLPLAPKQSKNLPGKKPESPYRTIKGATEVTYRIGRSPLENDELTKKSPSHHHWAHVIEGGGSHVLFRCPELSPGVKKEAAMLALHFSKKRNDRAGEVYLTQRRFLRKTKGLPPGLWLVDKAETFYLSYEEAEIRQLLEQNAPKDERNGDF